MTTVFTNSPSTLDFEENNLNDCDSTYTTGTGVVDTVSSPALEGSYSFRGYTTSGSSGDVAFGCKNITNPANDKIYVYFLLQTTGHGNCSYDYCCLLAGINEYAGSTDGGSMYIGLHLDPQGDTIRMRAHDSADYQECGIEYSISEDTEYEIEFLYDWSGTNVYVELWIDGVSIGDWTGSGKRSELTSPVLNFGVGAYNWHVGSYSTTYFDEVQAEDARIGGLAQVYQDLSAQWDLAEIINKDLAAQWDLLNAVDKDQALQWDILSLVNKDHALQWDIAELIYQDLTLVWDMEGVIQKDLSLAWDVFGLINKDLAAEWDLFSLVNKDHVLAWDIFGLINKDLSLVWDMEGVAYKDLVVVWDMEGVVNKDLILVWDIEGAVNKDLILQWDLFNTINKDQALTWDILVTANQDQVLNWDIAELANKDLGLQWDLLESVNKDLTLAWDIVGLFASIVTLTLDDRSFVLDLYERSFVLTLEEK